MHGGKKALFTTTDVCRTILWQCPEMSIGQPDPGYDGWLTAQQTQAGEKHLLPEHGLRLTAES